jgi:uncharacterized protein YukE
MSQQPQTTSIQTSAQLTSGTLPSYANEHDPSWEEVIAMVVIPGHGEAITAAAGNWDLLLSRVKSVSGHIQELSSQLGSWEGEAGDAYRGHLKELTDGLDQIVDTHQHVPENLRKAATDVNAALNKIPIPDELVDEALRARDQFKATGQLDTTFHQGFFADKLFPGFMDIAGDIFGFLTFGLADKASDMLRDFISDGDDQAKQAFQELNGQHSSTQGAMSEAAAGKYQDLQTEFTPSTTDLARTNVPSVVPDLHGAGTGLQGAGAGPIANTSSFGPGGLGSIGSGTGSGAAGVGGIGAGGGGSGIRPGGLTSAGSAIRGTPTPMAGGGMAGAGRGTSAAGARVGGAGAGAGKAGGMGGAPMGGAGGGAAGARAGGAGSRTGVPGVAAGKAGGAGGKAGAGAGARGGMMGGGGAHGGGSEDATDHSTWLQEDEDVWGTDSDAAPPVLGS